MPETSEELQEKNEKQRKEYWLEVEANRKKQEQYKMKEISPWMYWSPVIGCMATIIALVMIGISESTDTYSLWWIMGIGATPAILFGLSSYIRENWEASLAAKEQIEAGKRYLEQFKPGGASFFDPDDGIILNGFEYTGGYIYTDSVFNHHFYQFTKFILAFLTICLGLLAAALAFMWFGAITIAPTTVIIILLVLILLK